MVAAAVVVVVGSVVVSKEEEWGSSVRGGGDMDYVEKRLYREAEDLVLQYDPRGGEEGR